MHVCNSGNGLGVKECILPCEAKNRSARISGTVSNIHEKLS